MRQKQWRSILQGFKKGFLVGAMASLCVYGFARIVCYEFTVPLLEEAVNIGKIMLTGGFLVAASCVLFLLLESCILYIRSTKISLPGVNFKKEAVNVFGTRYKEIELNRKSQTA